MNKWYVAFFDDEWENEYTKAKSDEEAVEHFRYEHDRTILEVWECTEDECLSPFRQVQL